MEEVLEEGIKGNYTNIVQGYVQGMELDDSLQHLIGRKCIYLLVSLRHAYNQHQNGMPLNYGDCCDKAVEELKFAPMQWEHIESRRTIEKWFRHFKSWDRKIVIPSIMMDRQDSKIPIFLQRHVELTDAMMDYVDTNLTFLSIDRVHEFVNRAIRFIAINEEQYYEASSKQNTEGIKFKHIDIGKNDFTSKDSLKSIILKVASNEKTKKDIGRNNKKRRTHKQTTNIKDNIQGMKQTQAKNKTENKKSDENTSMEEHCKKILQKQHVSHSTVQNWMKALGYSYKEHKKTFYCDAHERQDTIEYRDAYLKRYLLEYEPYMLRWVQVKMNVIKEKFENNGKFVNVNDENNLRQKKKKKRKRTNITKITEYDEIMKRGRKYTDKGIDMIEFHVDSISDEWCKTKLEDEINTALNKHDGLGTNMSWFRKNKKRRPLIDWGQDEAIFKQYLSTKNTWTGRNGEFPIRPKDDGSGLMISGMQGRSYGFGCCKWNKDTMKTVNDWRKLKKN